MKHIGFKINEHLKFVSLHTIDTVEWRPRFKPLTDFDIIFSLKGKTHIQLDSENYWLDAHQAFLAVPGQTIRILSDTEPKTGVWVLHFQAASYEQLSMQDLLIRLGKVEDGRITDTPLYLNRFMSLKGESIYQMLLSTSQELKYKRFGFMRKLNLYLLDILYELHRSSAEDILFGNINTNYTTSNMYCRIVIDYLHNHFMYRVLSRDIEAHVNLSYDYINSLFKEMIGTSIMNCLDDIRITKARELIDTTSLPLYKIAEIVGIPDSHYFSKKFKKFTGMAPSKYRKNYSSGVTAQP